MNDTFPFRENETESTSLCLLNPEEPWSLRREKQRKREQWSEHTNTVKQARRSKSSFPALRTVFHFASVFLDHFTSSIYFWPLHTEICPIFFQSSDDILYCRWCDIRHLCNFTFKNMFFKLFHNFYMQVLCTGSPICASLLSEKLFLYPIITLLMFLHLFLFQLFFALFPTCWRHFAAIKFKVRRDFSWNTKTCQFEYWILRISRTVVVTLRCTQLWDFNPKQPESFSFVTLTESRSRRRSFTVTQIFI